MIRDEWDEPPEAEARRCQWCRGTGKDLDDPHYRCPDCDGSGREVDECSEDEDVTETEL